MEKYIKLRIEVEDRESEDFELLMKFLKQREERRKGSVWEAMRRIMEMQEYDSWKSTAHK